MKVTNKTTPEIIGRSEKKQSAKVITLTGYYGAGNLGDDLMLQALIHHLLNDPDIILNIFQFNHTTPLPIIANNRINTIKIPPKGINRFLTAARTLLRTDWLIFGGGTCFTDSAGDGSFKLFMLAKLLGCRLGYIGVGIGDLNHQSRKWKTKILLRISDLITFRDNRSYTYGLALAGKSSDNKIYKTEDLCYLGIDNQTSGKVENTHDVKPVWVISVRPLEQYLPKEQLETFWDDWTDWLYDILKKNRPLKIVFLPIDDQRDIPISKTICQSIKDKDLHHNNLEIAVENNLSADEKRRLLASADHIISMRLHACLLGYAYNVPTFGIAYCKKVIAFYESIGSNCFAEIYDWLTNTGKPAISIPADRYCFEYSLQKAKDKALMNIDILKSYL